MQETLLKTDHKSNCWLDQKINSSVCYLTKIEDNIHSRVIHGIKSKMANLRLFDARQGKAGLGWAGLGWARLVHVKFKKFL